MALDEDIARGGEADQILRSTLFIGARKRVLEGIESQMRQVPLSDQTMHTRLILALQVWDQFEKYFEQIKQTGEIAQFQVRQEEERKKRWSVFS
jgi:predicted nucleotidyltransferase